MNFFLFGAFGLIFGSFLNVVILRQGTGRDVSGRSGCFSCGHTLAWYDLVPVVSWVFLRGRCRYCGSSISIQYPLVELLTAVTFGLIGLAPFEIDLFYRIGFCVIDALLIMIAVYDARHTIIPDPWVYSFGILSFLIMTPFFMMGNDTSLLFILSAGPLVALPLFLLWFFSQGKAMGFGDVKLAVGMGYLLGPWYGLYAVFLSFMLGGAYSVPLLVLSSGWWKQVRMYFTHRLGVRLPVLSVSMKSEVPFGPFLVLSTMLVWMSWLFESPFIWPFV